jgi:hypothetical protein
MNVYQGSPHRFPPTAKNPLGEFDASKIGTGEGAQAYGHGHYSAEARDVAKSYGTADIGKNKDFRSVSYDGQTYSQTDPMAHSLFEVASQGRAPVIQKLQSQANRLASINPEMAAKLEEKIAFIKTINPDKVTFDSGNLYTIDLPDEHIAKMLHWDKPLSEQPHILPQGVTVADFVESIKGRKPTELEKMQVNLLGRVERGELDPNNVTGRNIYEGRNTTQYPSPADFSQKLREAGIPGIRYFDGSSRAASEGTSNFVVFPGNEDMMRIINRE